MTWKEVRIRKGDDCAFCRKPVAVGTRALRGSVPPWDPDNYSMGWETYTLHLECSRLLLDLFEGEIPDNLGAFFEDFVELGVMRDDGGCFMGHGDLWGHTVEQYLAHPYQEDVSARDRTKLEAWATFYRELPATKRDQ